MKCWITVALLALAATAHAQNPRVLLDTDYGPVVVELAAGPAPISTENFLAYVNAGTFNRTVFHRVERKNAEGQGIDIVQGGGFTDTGAPIEKLPTIASERLNGLSNNRGTIAYGLTNNSTGQPNFNSTSSDFYFNVTANPSLNGTYTVFGSVVSGLAALDAMHQTPRFTAIPGTQPIRPPFIKRALQIPAGEFPLLDLHTGAWFDPDKAGRGFGVEIAQAAAADSGPLLVVYWYDYADGEQVWMNGAAGFTWGDTRVTVPMQITRGGQFGDAFDPSAVESDPTWGQLTVRFTGCDTAEFSYTSAFGDGSLSLRRLTIPTGSRCD